MKKRFYVRGVVACWQLIERRRWPATPCDVPVQTFPTRKEARKWAKLANHPNAVLAWGNTGKLVSVQIADGAMGSIYHV